MKQDPAPGVNGSPSLLLLFASFLRMGLTAFGGPAMVAYIRKRVVVQKHWLDADSFHAGVALCQAIPGATVMQIAAYIGLKLHGVQGAMCCYLGFGLPAFLLMLALSMAYSHAHALPAVISVFSGLQAVVVAIVANATVAFGKTALTHWKHGLIALVAAGLFGFKVNPVIIVLLAALLGQLLNGRPPAPRKAAHTGRMGPTTRPLLFFLLVSVTAFTLLFIFSNELFQLAVLMSKIDLLAFGGGVCLGPAHVSRVRRSPRLDGCADIPERDRVRAVHAGAHRDHGDVCGVPGVRLLGRDRCHRCDFSALLPHSDRRRPLV